ncbi:MAG: class I SAM-dependent methyltransferase [Planctomycetota bacterium]|nr:MAG: class I SAM-dependent methyltransferase [Planctomycetota bacterium]
MSVNQPPRRRPLQGLCSVLCFNWPFYALALLAIALATAMALLIPLPWAWLAVAIIALAIFGSLFGTWLAYDSGGLYDLEWLRGQLPGAGRGLILDAGFDEISPYLKAVFPQWQWWRGDFFQAASHREASIRRARERAQADHTAAAPDLSLRSTALPLVSASMGVVVLFLAAHEIRDDAERRQFLSEVRRLLAPGGVVVLVEHLRDLANTCAYTLGVGHFHSASTWRADWQAAGLRLRQQHRHRGLISAFILEAGDDPLI